MLSHILVWWTFDSRIDLTMKYMKKKTVHFFFLCTCYLLNPSPWNSNIIDEFPTNQYVFKSQLPVLRFWNVLKQNHFVNLLEHDIVQYFLHCVYFTLHLRTTVKYSLIIKYKKWLTWEVYFIYLIFYSLWEKHLKVYNISHLEDQKYFCNGSPSVLSIWLMTDWHIFSTSSSSSLDKQNTKWITL